MRSFRFRLDSALRWRQSRTLQRELELRALLQVRMQLIRDRDLVRQERHAAVAELRLAPMLTGADLLKLRHFVDVSMTQENRLDVRIRDADERCQEAKRLFQEASREEKMLNVLRQKALEDWRKDYLKDVELVAGETFLANWARRQPGT
ncbi:MAG: hypothetical protein IPP47_22170 [Bryobacterales bacterium]|nr:hypothetical protein [Bryobacterales bacterium]